MYIVIAGTSEENDTTSYEEFLKRHIQILSKEK
jgi:hypothetical protein